MYLTDVHVHVQLNWKMTLVVTNILDVGELSPLQ
jgi:hypothetical protein